MALTEAFQAGIKFQNADYHNKVLKQRLTKSAKEFDKQLNQIALYIDESFDVILKKTVIDLYTKIAMETPVDTGLARSSWSLDTKHTFENEGYYGVHGDPDNFSHANNMIKGKAVEFAAKNTQNSKTYYIYNNVNYIELLEMGSSTQAPSGMVAVNLSGFAARLRENANKYTERTFR